MEKRYQVFISSTFQDLQPARQEVSQALLRADCFPAGMELFPAADEEQFEFIKQIIDQSDYYIIISAGRYGSIHPETGLSYTEMEYDYAVETGKPVIRLLHKDPFNQLKGEFIEKTDLGKQQLGEFREKLRANSLVRYWAEPNDLGREVSFSLREVEKSSPAVGWNRNELGGLFRTGFGLSILSNFSITLFGFALMILMMGWLGPKEWAGQGALAGAVSYVGVSAFSMFSISTTLAMKENRCSKVRRYTNFAITISPVLLLLFLAATKVSIPL